MRRVLPIVVGTLIVLGGIGGLLLVFQSRDGGSLDTPAAAEGPGNFEVDLGNTEGPDTKKLSVYPPTSGPHPTALPTREGAWTDGEVIAALEQGNVVLIHPEKPAPPEFLALQKDLAGPYTTALAEAGQAVVLVRRPGNEGFQALAWRRRLETSEPGDRALRDFIESWLGVGPPQ